MKKYQRSVTINLFLGSDEDALNFKTKLEQVAKKEKVSVSHLIRALILKADPTLFEEVKNNA